MNDVMAVKRPTGDESESEVKFRQAALLLALSYALGISDVQPQGRSVRACMIGMLLAVLEQEVGSAIDAQALAALCRGVAASAWSEQDDSS
jgi:hypothetical protein